MPDSNVHLPCAAGARPPVTFPAPADSYRVLPPGGDIELDHPAVPLSHYLWILRRQRWKILAFVCFCVSAAAIVSMRLTPIYEGTATVDVDRQTPNSIIGQEALRMPLNDADQFLATQIAHPIRFCAASGRLAIPPPRTRGRHRRGEPVLPPGSGKGAGGIEEAARDAAPQYLSAAHQLPLPGC